MFGAVSEAGEAGAAAGAAFVSAICVTAETLTRSRHSDVKRGGRVLMAPGIYQMSRLARRVEQETGSGLLGYRLLSLPGSCALGSILARLAPSRLSDPENTARMRTPFQDLGDPTGAAGSTEPTEPARPPGPAGPGSPATNTRHRRRNIRRLVQVTIAVLGVALAWRMVQWLSWDELSQRVREAQPALLIAAVLLLAGRWYIWQARWGLSLSRIGDRTGFVQRASALMASVFVNHVALRLFGGVLRARYIAAGRAKDFAHHYGIVLFDQLMHQTATTVYTWLAVGYVFFLLGWTALGWTAVISIALLVAAVPFVIGRKGWFQKVAARISDKASRSGRLHGLVQQGSAIPGMVAKLLGSIPHVGKTAVLTWVYIGLNVLAQWLLFRAIDADIPFFVVAAVLGIGSVIGTLTGLPGGLGPMEAALIGGYDLLGVGRLEAVAGTLLYRGLHYILVLVFGLPSLITVELGLERARERLKSEELPSDDDS